MQLTIKEQRRQLQRLLDDNPSLGARLEEFLPECYEDAVIQAARETGFEETDFPADCPYTGADIVDPNYLPD